MRARTVDHSAKKPAAVERRDGGQLVVAWTSGVAEVPGQRTVGVQERQEWLRGFRYAGARWILNVAGGAEGEISPTGQRGTIEEYVAAIDLDDAVRAGRAIVPDQRSECIPTASEPPSRLCSQGLHGIEA
jgi:hypothetical protein